jgi:uncharacterized protein (UPF0248 family)
MITIAELLNKIRWDKREKPEEYSILYLDRITRKLNKIEYTDIKRIDDGFMVLMRDNEETNIPLHRIRTVLRCRKTVWKR